MALNESELKKQVARLKTLPRGEERPWGVTGRDGEPGEPGLRDELLRVLWRQAVSDEHAQRIIDEIIQVSQFCPSPAELIEIAEKVPTSDSVEREFTVRPTRCNDCGDTGWKTAVRVVNGERYEVSLRCDHKTQRKREAQEKEKGVQV